MEGTKIREPTAEKHDLPPLIVHYMISEGKEEGDFELNDGNHRWEAYTRMGVENVAVIVWITDDYEYDQFMQRFGFYTD